MLGILLLFLNNHRKLADTVNNVKYTAKNFSKAKNDGKKYFYDRNGKKYDINTGHMVVNGIDKYNNHRGIIDAETGRAIEDYIEQQIEEKANRYINNEFVKIKERLDSRKKYTSKASKEYFANDKSYSIYWDNEVKRVIDVCKYGTSYDKYKAKYFIKKGYSEEEIYEYYCWKGDKINYPIDVANNTSKYILR